MRVPHCGLPPTFTQPHNGELRCVKTSDRRKLCCCVHFIPYVVMEIYLSDLDYIFFSFSQHINLGILRACILQAYLRRNNSVEMARELIGLGQLISHVFDHVTSPLDLATDSASARQVSMMSGFLRRMRHVDLRLCFLQEASRFK